MSYGSQPGSGLSIVALVCAVGAFFGFGPMLAIVAMFCAVFAMARGEGMAGIAVLISLVVLVLSFVMPSAIVLGGA